MSTRIITNHMLAVGRRDYMGKLKETIWTPDSFKEFVEKTEDEHEFMQIPGIFFPEEERSWQNDDFGFINIKSVNRVWDVVQSSQAFDETLDYALSTVTKYLLNSGLEQVGRSSDFDCIYLAFQTENRKPNDLFREISKQNPHLSFMWYCDGQHADKEFGFQYHYKMGKQTSTTRHLEEVNFIRTVYNKRL